MISVALIGADGAGKTTIARKLEEDFEKPIKYLYMGVSMQSSNAVLPTSKLAHWVKRKISKKKGVKMESGPPVNADGTIKRKKKSGLRSVLRLANRLAEVWYRQYLSWKFRRQGNVVIYDRHFQFDYGDDGIFKNGHDVRVTDRIHRWLLANFYPSPDLVIFLDAPGEVLFARKGEGNIEYLEARLPAFLKQGECTPNFMRFDATQPPAPVYSPGSKRGSAGLQTNSKN